MKNVKKNRETKKKLMAAALVLIGLSVMPARDASADSDPSNDSDSLTIVVTPRYDFGVDITTTPAAMNLGTVDLYASTFTVQPATVTFLGSKAGQELDLSAALSGGWKFDVSPSTWAAGGEQDALAVYALFSSTNLAAAPAGDDFANATAAAGFNVDAQTLGPVRAGGLSGPGAKYEKQGAGAVDLDMKNPGDKAHLWFLLRLPSQTSVTAAQNVSVTLTATIDNL